MWNQLAWWALVPKMPGARLEMTRRQFLACLLMAMVVLVCLPLVKFAEWGERWFGKRERDFEMRLLSYGQFLNRSPAYLHPTDYAKYKAAFA